jgi:hypothetical protein
MRTPKIAQPGVTPHAGSGSAAAWIWLRTELAALTAPVFWIALILVLLAALLAPQLPRTYRIDVGLEEGVGSDLPFLQGFNTAERGEHGTYRWTTDGAQVVVPALGARPLIVTFYQLPIAADVLEAGPQHYTIWANARQLAELPVRRDGGPAAFVVPADALRDGALDLRIGTDTFSPPGDPRLLGTPLGLIRVTAATAAGFVRPAQQALLAWLGVLIFSALAVRHATGAHGRTAQHWLILISGSLIAVAAVLDPPRWAFGARAALTAAALSYPLAIGLRAGVPALARRLNLALPEPILGGLTAIAVISFGLRYGGRLYPNAMHGDIGFHVNRFNETIGGLIFMLSKNRGVDFPYPPGPYLLVAPFTLLGLSPATALELGAALVDALSAIVIYAIAVRIMRPPTALLAAGIYVFTAATFMTTWWSFDTHIYTQFVHLLLIATLALAAAAWQQDDRALRRRWTWAAGVLASMVFLGHFGFLINTALLLGLLVGAAWIAAWRGSAWAQRVRMPLTIATIGAGAFAAIFFYTAYIPLFLEQLATARSGGLTAVAGRDPVSRAVLWDTLWRAGLVTHFGFFPVPLAVVGIAVLSIQNREPRTENREPRTREPRNHGTKNRESRTANQGTTEPRTDARRAVLALMVGSLVVALTFAIFPFIAGVTNSPRWLMFIAWVIAVGGAAGAQAIRQRGWAGQFVVLAMGALVLLNTAWIWLGPMLWRIRPPEPF